MTVELARGWVRIAKDGSPRTASPAISRLPKGFPRPGRGKEGGVGDYDTRRSSGCVAGGGLRRGAKWRRRMCGHLCAVGMKTGGNWMAASRRCGTGVADRGRETSWVR